MAMLPNMKDGIDRVLLGLPRCLCRLITDAFLHLLPLFLWDHLVVQADQIVLQMLFNIAALRLQRLLQRVPTPLIQPHLGGCRACHYSSSFPVSKVSGVVLRGDRAGRGRGCSSGSAMLSIYSLVWDGTYLL